LEEIIVANEAPGPETIRSRVLFVGIGVVLVTAAVLIYPLNKLADVRLTPLILMMGGAVALAVIYLSAVYFIRKKHHN
jgi:predicted transporter